MTSALRDLRRIIRNLEQHIERPTTHKTGRATGAVSPPPSAGRAQNERTAK